MPKFRVIAIALVVGAFAAAARGQTSSAASVYRLGAGSDFQTGCFPPCLCPSLPKTGKPKGTFRLAFGGITGAVRTYHVRDVNWFVDLPAATALAGTMTRITGSGTYTITTGSIVPVHRLELDLVVGANAPEHFDSGLIPATGPLFPEILIRVTINGGKCQDTVIDVGAAPVPAAAMRGYHLENSTYGAGCFPPCCVGPPLQSVAGGFTLVSLPSYANTVSRGSLDYAVLNANWTTGPSTTPGQNFRGDGIYRRRFGPAVTPANTSTHRLLVDLKPGNAPAPITFDSGWKAAGPAVAASVLPNIDIEVSAAAFACQDQRFGVHGRPNP